MADPLSIASGIAGLITLSSAVVAGGYKYLSSVASAPQDLQDLICEIASMNTVLSRLVSHSLSLTPYARQAFDSLANQKVLQDCEETLRSVQKHIQDCEPVDGQRRKNVLNALKWPLKQKDIVKSRERVSRLCATLNTAIAVDNASTLQRMEQKQDLSIRTAAGLMRLSVDADEHKILDWLSILSPTTRHMAITQLQQPGTLDWFLCEQPVVDWFQDGGFLWLNGTSGTGKTVLISGVINHLLAGSLTARTSEALLYHYCDFANPPSLDVTQIMGSLVRQLVDQMDYFPSEVRNAYNRFSRDGAPIDVLISLLIQLATKAFKKTTVILDGIDESPTRQPLLDAINKLHQQTQKTKLLSILLSSRPEYDIRQAFSTERTFSLSPKLVQASLETHVRIELTKMPRLLRLPAPDKEGLVMNLVSRADGMFRWVQCQLDVLRKIRTPRALQDALKSLPEGLHETYDRILSRIDDLDYEYVIRMLKWLVGTERVLSLEELAEGIAIDPLQDRFDPAERLMEPEEVLDICGSLVRLEEDRTVVLAHFSVKEYLLSKRLAAQQDDTAKFALQQVQGQHHVTECLLTYLSTIGLHIQELRNQLLEEKQYPLFTYAKGASSDAFRDPSATGPWIERHFPRDGAKLLGLLSLVDYVNPPAPFRENWSHARFIQHVLQCSMMCYWNAFFHQDRLLSDTSIVEDTKGRIADLFLDLQQTWDDPKCVPTILTHYDPRTTPSPLCTATAHGCQDTIRFLLSKGAKVDGMSPGYHMGHALSIAVRCSQEEVVPILKEFGATFDICSIGTCFSTILDMTGMYCRKPWFIESLLTEGNMDVNMLDPKGRTIHYWAKYDSYISRTMLPFAPLLEKLRRNDVDFRNDRVLYTTMLQILRGMRGHTSLDHYYGRVVLSQCLIQLGPAYYDYAAIFEEQEMASTTPVTHSSRCNACPRTLNEFLRGKRYHCLVCMDTDFCSDCYGVWKQSNGEMELCKGHAFYQIPRDCWYGLKEGTVTEDGKLLAEVIAELEEKVKKLLDDLDANNV